MSNVIKTVSVFTDGACKNNGKKDIRKPVKAGIGIYFPNKEIDNIAEPFTLKPITNQRAELYAVYTALISLIKKYKSRLNKKNIVIYTDSKYTINSLTEWVNTWVLNGWKIKNSKKDVKNKDIIEPIYNIIKLLTVTFIHVKAHTGNKDLLSVYNSEADNLANIGAL